ncbi:hypothetical protein BT69DRAFT_1260885 [Atractiella rhizophila]|nr:hypothetical protein BT69DRAFT_1260885 [Atractiella rhizophila]
MAFSALLAILTLPLSTFCTPIKAGNAYDNSQLVIEDGWIEASRTHGVKGFFDPGELGGRCTTAMSWERDLGEPLNIIISGHSSPDILTDKGMLAWARSIRFAPECLGMHRGAFQQANLGDGQGWLDEMYELRQSYIPLFGTCIESAIGGNHFRAWRQNGTEANSGAWFIAASKEKDASKYHKIVPNGYDTGRNLIVNAAVRGSCWKGSCWKTTVEYAEGLIPPGKDGINHGIEQDGRVAVFTIKKVK